MELSIDKLKILWKKRDEIFNDKKNQYIVDRFQKITELFDNISKIQIIEGENEIKLNKNNVEYSIHLLDEKDQIMNVNLKDYWISAEQNLTANNNDEGTAAGVIKMSKRFTIFPQTSSTSDIDLQQLVLDIGCVLGGYNFMTPENTNTYMYQEYRIKSNTRTSPNDNGSLITGINQFPSAHLADNNVFFRIIQTFQNMVTDQFDPKESFVVLQWKDKNERNKETRSLFCSILNYLFLYKMLYSWAHCESMIPLFSLMEYQKLCQQSNQGKLKYNDDNINQSYNDFKTNWAVYSHEIANNLDH